MLWWRDNFRSLIKSGALLFFMQEYSPHLFHQRGEDSSMIENDSSPQLGRNLLLVECYFIRGDSLLLAEDLMTYLYDFSHLRELSPFDAQAIQQAQDKLASLIDHHVFPPCGMGSRHANFPHKD